MKGLIRKILKEEVGGDALSRLRIILTKMKSTEGWEKFIYEIDKNKKMVSMPQLTGPLWALLKYIGYDTTQSYGTASGDTLYWIVSTFMKNGGYDRDFKEGEIRLVEIPVYEMEGQYTEEQYVYKTGWGEIIGVNGEKEAINIFENDIDNYIEDSEEDDRDYGDSYGVENVEVQNIRTIKFNPEWVGL